MSRSDLGMYGLVIGAWLSLGVVALIAVLRGWRPRVRGSGRLWRRGRRAVQDLPAGWRDNYRLLLATAAVATVLVWALSGWPIHGLLTGVAIAGMPFVLYPGGSEHAEVARVEALAEWLHQLSSVRSGGKPLEQMLRELGTVPALLRRESDALAERLASGMPAPRAYRLLGDDLDSRIGDDIVRLFRDHVRSRGQGLSEALSAQAALLDKQASDLHDIEAERRKARSEARRVSIFALLMVAGILASPSYSAPFATPLGQLGLIALGVSFVLALLWLRRMARMEPEPRTSPTAKERADEEQAAGRLEGAA
ncbi:type II secretion system F family protein [Streptomyces sp. LHD-70]|uniref:type II secretion system F family protein n=1 Tax=Streptomyces sp. LHD-70 TaxID=3072140 RepID=UPI00280E57D8|nr:type II secretion system F family protein [Streptomyces sp. LHD-70]MDQ8707517.1 type II secretion system F family protein [Streptomyces sp. LHD-70]